MSQNCENFFAQTPRRSLLYKSFPLGEDEKEGERGSGGTGTGGVVSLTLVKSHFPLLLERLSRISGSNGTNTHTKRRITQSRTHTHHEG